MVGQPLRVTEGSAEVTVRPDERRTARSSGRRARWIFPHPAREIAFETTYDFGLEGDDQALAAGAFLRLYPDHDPDAGPDAGFGLKYSLAF